ncbi:LysR family transcriptional regulator [Stutzerimonas zhaodongensis]|uniref:LysR family transcriptional regulator n=1 Tax=Stutzerimonas TaxID=2901164 RepID=UPI00388DFE55
MSALRTVDLVLLRTFLSVAQTGSIGGAARQLHLTQGAISQQIKRLEHIFGCRLLERDPQGARLTDRGMDLLPKARSLLDLNDLACEEMIGLGTREKVRVGVPYDMAGAHFAPVLSAYARRHPDVDVTVVSGSSVDLMTDFSKGPIDLTIGQCPERESNGERLCLEPLVWIGTSDDVISQRPLPLCFVTPTCTFRHIVFSVLREAHISWRVVFENASVDTTLATVRSGLALTPWLRSLMPDDVRMLGAESGLPPLPNFAIQLHVSPGAAKAAMDMAESIRERYR